MTTPMISKIMNVIECINLMLKDWDGSELYYHPADNSIYRSEVGKSMKLLKDGKGFNQYDILCYLIGYREGLCLN